MRFEGSAKIDTSPARIWDAMTSPQMLMRLTPSVLTVDVVEPNKSYDLEIGQRLGKHAVRVLCRVVWTDFRPNLALGLNLTGLWGGQTVEADGQIALEGNDELASATVNFSAEITKLPTSLPKPLIHQLTQNAIRSYFTNLKAAMEAPQSE